MTVKYTSRDFYITLACLQRTVWKCSNSRNMLRCFKDCFKVPVKWLSWQIDEFQPEGVFSLELLSRNIVKQKIATTFLKIIFHHVGEYRCRPKQVYDKTKFYPPQYEFLRIKSSFFLFTTRHQLWSNYFNRTCGEFLSFFLPSSAGSLPCFQNIQINNALVSFLNRELLMQQSYSICELPTPGSRRMEKAAVSRISNQQNL